MARTNIAIQDLLNVLKKVGAPVDGSSYEMGQFMPQLPGAVQGQVYGQDGQIPEFARAWKAQLDRIAQMDQKLAGVYGDPSSDLFIEDASAREGFIQGAAQTGYKAAGDFTTLAQQRRKELDDEIRQAEALFSDLKTAKGQEEAETRRQEREAKSNAKKASRGSVRKSGDTSGAADREHLQWTKAEQRTLDRAGLTDPQAQSEFLYNTPAQFRRQWINEVNKGVIKPGSTVEDIRKRVKLWEKHEQAKKDAKKKETAKKKPSTSKNGALTPEELKALAESYKK